MSLLRVHSLPGLYGSSGKGQVEFKGWLAKGDYRISEIGSAGGVVLHVPNKSPLVESLSFDLARFACAACESTRGLEEDEQFPKATAWASIRLYYSAFFAAHAILRYFGTSCSQVDYEQSLKVTQFANSIYGIASRMQSGFYCARFNSVSSDLVMSKYSDSHKDTWKCFKELLGDVRQLVLDGTGLTTEKLKIAQLIEELVSACLLYTSDAADE